MNFLNKIQTKKIIFFGVGSLYEKFISFNKIIPTFLIDNDENKIGTYKGNLKINSPKILSDQDKDNIYIIITSSYYEEIAAQLKSLHFAENVHFFSGLQIYFYLLDEQLNNNLLRVQLALSKGLLSKKNNFSSKDTRTWEYSVFSQNNEDGIIEYLTENIKRPNRYFIEIGSSNGVENNSSYLAIVKKYNGLMIEGDALLSEQCTHLISRFNIGVTSLHRFVTKENVGELIKISSYKDPDFFSLDIDGNDFYILESLLKFGLRPKIICVEYNSAFGPQKSLSIEYDENFVVGKQGKDILYYGASLSAWKKLLEKFGYLFLTVESNGVNAFFINLDSFNETLLKNINIISFAENFIQKNIFNSNWEEQFFLIKDRRFKKIY